MSRWEYKVVPAPTKGMKAKGVKTPEARFALAVETTINTLAAEGWMYHRTDMLPSIERAGLTSTSTQWRNLLIFKRPLAGDETPEVLEMLPPPEEVSDAEADDAPADASDEATDPASESTETSDTNASEEDANDTVENTQEEQTDTRQS